jgi:class 3 adenylate cyclase/tetratricopeptide (TPR) repeat protein
MKKQKELEKAIRGLESQRNSLGDAAVDAALEVLYQRLTDLENSETQDQAKDSATEYLGERRVVTVLFCDVAGSTSLAEGMDPEAWTEIMKATFEHLIEPVERYGGTVARLMGDAILAFFGAPTAHEDDPQRAILAALDIVDNIAPLRETLDREKGLNFNVRVGINTGLAVVGDVGSEAAGEYTAMGDAVNLAARMEQTAAPGTVQIAQNTYTLVAPLFDFKELGGISIKGKGEPVLAYQVLGRKIEPGQLRGLTEQGISSPLVGREIEFESAQNAVERLLTGQGGILVIQGEAGIGKSRLMAELHNATFGADREIHKTKQSLQSMHWLEGHTLTFGQTISYWPFQEILRSYAGIKYEDSGPATLHKLEERIEQLFAEETTEILPYLASLLSIEMSGDYAERVKYLDGEALGRQVYRAFRRFFQRLADERPLVLVFDDLHWMDASSVGLLEHLLPLTERVPLLLCGVSRPDPETPTTRLLEIANEQYGSHLTEIELAPLSPNDSRRLVQNLLEIDGLPEQTRQMMLAKADGNPFYLEEIVRDLIENGALVQEASTGRWQATQRIEKVTVPDTIQGLLITRIDRLDENLKRVVRRAAVIGRAFLYRVLNAVLDDDLQLEGQLDQLQSVELIQEKQQIPELEYIFKHALVQEAAYDGILLQERRELHGRVGAAIESLFADRLDDFYGLLAHHYSAAEIWDKAQEYLFKAGDQAGSLAADTEALTNYRLAMEAYARVRGDDWPTLERAQLERKIGEALYRLGQHGQSRPYLERSLALLGAELPTSHWGTRLAIARALLVQAAHQMLPGLFVRSMGGTLDPVAEEIFKTSRVLGGVELLANVERSLLLTVRALNTSERRGYAYGSAVLSASMGGAAVLTGRFGLAQRYFRRSEDYAKLTNPFRPVPELDVSFAAYFNMLSDLKKMQEHAQQGMEIARKAGNLRQWALSKSNLVWSLWGRAEYDRATDECEQLLQAAEDSSDQQMAVWGMLAEGCIHLRRGLAKDAIASFQRGIEIAEELPDYLSLSGLSGWMGRSYLTLGKVEQAIDLMEGIEQLLSNQIGLLPGYAYLGNGLAEAYLTKAERSDGQVRLTWLKKTHPILRRTLKDARRNRMVLPDALMFQGRYEWLHGKPKKAQEWWARALAQAEDTGLRYQEGEVHLEIGRRLGDRHHLMKAESILEEIGAELVLAAAREALANLGES